MKTIDLNAYPVIQEHMRQLVTFGFLDQQDRVELFAAIADVIERLEELEEFRSRIVCIESLADEEVNPPGGL